MTHVSTPLPTPSSRAFFRIPLLNSKDYPEIHERYRRIKSHRGHKKAIIAVCKMLLTAIWNILSTGEAYNASGYLIQTPRPTDETKVLTQNIIRDHHLKVIVIYFGMGFTHSITGCLPELLIKAAAEIDLTEP